MSSHNSLFCRSSGWDGDTSSGLKGALGHRVGLIGLIFGFLFHNAPSGERFSGLFYKKGAYQHVKSVRMSKVFLKVCFLEGCRCIEMNL